MSAARLRALMDQVELSLLLIAILVLLVCSLYTFADLVLAPYPGIAYSPEWEVWEVVETEACSSDPEQCPILPDDKLLVIGDLALAQYRQSRTENPFDDYVLGDVVPIELERDGARRSVLWRMTGPAPTSWLRRLAGGLLTFFPFWLVGAVTLLFLRPRDTRWRLLVAFNYLIALWLATGSASASQAGGASLLLHAASWLMAPVFLHLHLVVPSKLFDDRALRRMRLLYVTAAILAILELFQILPDQAYLAGVLLAIVGSAGLLAFRLFAKSRSARLATRLLMAGVGLSFGPGILLWIVPTQLGASSSLWQLSIATFPIPLLSFFYIYTLYKRQLGNLEFRANRLLSLYSFILLYATAFIIIFFIGRRLFDSPNANLIFNLLASVVLIVTAIPLRSHFQRWFDRLAYGTEYNPDNIIRAFADQIPLALNRQALVQLLTGAVAPSLLIKQSALYLISDADIDLYYARGIELPETPRSPHIFRQLLAESGQYRSPDRDRLGEFDWVRLVVPIKLEEQTIGAWLLGRRDPDDFYRQSDARLLATLANQIGVALEVGRLFAILRQQAEELRQANEELRQLDRMKDEFIQTISHELRTPLTLVMGYIEVMQEGDLGAVTTEQQAGLQTMYKSSQRLAGMVNNIILLTGRLGEFTAMQPLDIAAIIRRSLDAAEATAVHAHVTLHAELSSNLPSVRGNEVLLELVFDNLIGNAIKFSRPGGRVFVSLRQRNANVGIEIRDEGIGIPADALPHIWDAFYQVDSSTTRQFGGSGLGLTIVKRIVERHGGHTWVESEIGQGSKFTCLLPASTLTNNGSQN